MVVVLRHVGTVLEVRERLKMCVNASASWLHTCTLSSQVAFHVLMLQRTSAPRECVEQESVDLPTL